ncbi:MAG TPA: hypothetical protein VIH93_14605 [Thermoanaerobaculia bacterium]
MAAIYFLVMGAIGNVLPFVLAGLGFVGLAAICWRSSAAAPR